MKKNNIEGWLFVSPLVIWISLIILVPIYIAFELSLFNVKIIGTSGKFVGIDNYIKLFGKSKFGDALEIKKCIRRRLIICPRNPKTVDFDKYFFQNMQ